MHDSQIIEQLQQRRDFLLLTIGKLEKQLLKAPEGSLLAKRSHNICQYYHKTSSAPLHVTYIRKSNSALAASLAQKEYNRAALATLKQELTAIQKYLSIMENVPPLKDIYSKMLPLKQPLITPLELPDSEFRKLWEAETYEGIPFSNDDPEYYTDKNEHVRSKSEILIANALNRLDIPYHYEKPLLLKKSKRIIYPDFTTLNMQTRKIIYIEHLGMMSNFSYVNNTLDKILDYEAEGIYPGEQLILFHEKNNQPLNTRLMSQILKHYYF